MSLDLRSTPRSDSVEASAPAGARQKILVGDCLKIMAEMPPDTVGVVVTSPPYNIGVAYNSYADQLPRDAYLDWMRAVAHELFRVMRPDGSLFLNVGSTNTDPWVAADVASCFREEFHLQNNISWIKSISVGDDTFGHFKPITSRRYLNNNHESVFHFTKTGSTAVDRLAVGVPFKDKSNIRRWGHAKDRRCAGNTWFIPYETVRSKAQKFDHPAGFPVELPIRCIKLHGQTDAFVFDPFLGAGTTLVAAQRLGLSGLGIEIDADYASAARDRLDKITR